MPAGEDGMLGTCSKPSSIMEAHEQEAKSCSSTSTFTKDRTIYRIQTNCQQEAHVRPAENLKAYVKVTTFCGYGSGALHSHPG